LIALPLLPGNVDSDDTYRWRQETLQNRDNLHIFRINLFQAGVGAGFYHYLVYNPAHHNQEMVTVNVGERFDAFLENLKITNEQGQDGKTKYKGVTGSLNRNYYGTQSDTLNSKLVGSWGKLTRVRPPRDIDLLYVLPYSVYTRFQTRFGNKQSQLLQEVKKGLLGTYNNTDVGGDRQVVLVPFASYKVEVVPAFNGANGQYVICDTNGGGRYKSFDPVAEVANLDSSDKKTNGNTRRLIRMMKCWQGYCNVPLKSFHIELLAIEFLNGFQYAANSTVYFDWMVRDFVKFLMGKAGGYVFAPGTNELLWLGSDWKTKSESALGRAEKACENESQHWGYLAGEEWQKIFGTQIPTG